MIGNQFHKTLINILFINYKDEKPIGRVKYTLV